MVEGAAIPWLTYVGVVLLSFYGGIAQHLAQVKRGECVFSWTALSGDVVLSGFVGLLIWFAVDAAGLSGKEGAMLTGIGAHMGARTLYLFESQWEAFLQRRLKRVLGNPAEGDDGGQD